MSKKKAIMYHCLQKPVAVSWCFDCRLMLMEERIIGLPVCQLLKDLMKQHQRQ